MNRVSRDQMRALGWAFMAFALVSALLDLSVRLTPDWMIIEGEPVGVFGMTYFAAIQIYSGLAMASATLGFASIVASIVTGRSGKQMAGQNEEEPAEAS